MKVFDSKWMKWIYAGIIFVIFLSISVPNAIMCCDDFFYQYVSQDVSVGGYQPENIHFTEVSQIIPLQIKHYSSTNGRFIVHVLVMLFVNFLGYGMLSVVNALLGTLLIFLLCKVAFPEKTVTVKALSLCLVFFFALLPFFNFGISFSNAAISMNYLLPGVGIALALSIFNRNRETAGRHTSAPGLILMCIVGIVMGSLHEGYCLPLGASFLIYMIFKTRKGFKTISKTNMVFFAGIWIGNLVLLCSPGNWNRFNHTAASSIFLSLKNRLSGIVHISDTFIPVVVVAIAILIAGVFLGYRFRKNISAILRKYRVEIFLAVFNLLFCYAAGTSYNAHVLQPISLMLIVIMLGISGYIASKYVKPRTQKIVAVFLTAVALTYAGTLSAHEYRNRIRYVSVLNQFKNSPDGIIYLPSNDAYLTPGTSVKLLGYDVVDHPKPWQWDGKAAFEYDIWRHCHGNDKKELLFTPYSADIPDNALIYDNEGWKVKTVEGKWWIIIENNDASKLQDIHVDGIGRFKGNVWERIYVSFKKKWQHHAFPLKSYLIPANKLKPAYLVVSKQDNATFHSLILKSGDSVVCTITDNRLR